MTAAEAIHRAWVVLEIGLVIFALGVAQVFMGKAFLGYGWPNLPPWVYRKDRPIFFWLNVAVFFVTGAFAIGLAASRLLQNSN